MEIEYFDPFQCPDLLLQFLPANRFAKLLEILKIVFQIISETTVFTFSLKKTVNYTADSCFLFPSLC